MSDSVILDQRDLTINDVVDVARRNVPLKLSNDVDALKSRLSASVNSVRRAVDASMTIYGVTTGFGGMSGVQVSKDQTNILQENLIWFLKAGAGAPLPREDVRGAMLLRARSFLWGVSAVRPCILERIETFLNQRITPVVREFGSIGASGDLIPLASIAGSLIGLDDQFRVHKGDDPTSRSARDELANLGLPPIDLEPKEGLGLVNGTSMSTAMAATSLYDARFLFAVTMGTHALMIQSLGGMTESFDSFIHERKNHPGQQWAARTMMDLLKGSKLTSPTRSGTKKLADTHHGALITLGRNPESIEWLSQLRQELEVNNYESVSEKAKSLLLEMAKFVVEEQSTEVLVDPIQDRYSVRCLPQFIGPIREGILTITRQVEAEMNSVNDNPLVGDAGDFYHGGNFLGQYVSVAMDQLRYYIGLMAKHLDAQISLLVAPEFSDGLAPSLVGNMERSVNMGLKGLQISANSIMPLLSYLGSPIADRFPTHAEQFNQNINSQSFNSARLARQSVNTFQQYMAICLLFSVQAAELRTAVVRKRESKPTTYDPSKEYLSESTRPLYEAVRGVVGGERQSDRPYLFDDDDRSLDDDIDKIATDLLLTKDGNIGKAIGGILETVASQ